MATRRPDAGDARDRMFEQARAAKAYASSISNPKHQEEVELAAFMAIFHPGKKAEDLAGDPVVDNVE